MTRIILADDHVMVRQGLRSIVSREPDMEVIGEADDGRACLELVEQAKPDIVIIDVGMPHLNGIDATRRIVQRFPRVKVVALSMHTDKQFVLEMFQAGASAYVTKDAAADELTRAVRAVASGRRYLSPQVTAAVVENALLSDTAVPAPAHSATIGRLTTREREILQLLAEGKTSSEIAQSLHLAVSTVETHRRNLTKKTGLRSVADLTKYAIRQGLTTLEF